MSLIIVIYQKLIKKYPKKYNKYIKKQTSNKFNL